MRLWIIVKQIIRQTMMTDFQEQARWKTGKIAATGYFIDSHKSLSPAVTFTFITKTDLQRHEWSMLMNYTLFTDCSNSHCRVCFKHFNKRFMINEHKLSFLFHQTKLNICFVRISVLVKDNKRHCRLSCLKHLDIYGHKKLCCS